VDDAVDPHFGALPEASAVEDGCPSRNEHLIFDHASDHMNVGAQQAVAADACGMALSAADNRVLHDDAARSNLDSTTFSDDRSPMQDSTVGADHDPPADSGRGRDVRGGINLRASAEV